jgi:hypothetical protein
MTALKQTGPLVVGPFLQRRSGVRGKLRFAAVGLLGVLGLALVRGGDVIAKEEAACGEYGTSVHFEKTPSDAARKALKEEKLVMVLHVSGNFEDPAFT